MGQFVAGAAKAGSARLNQMENRAQNITDRATERFMNQHDSWKRQYDIDKRAYNDAWEKLKGYDFLDDGQREMILLGGVNGADKFIAAYADDQKRKAAEYLKEPMATTESGFGIMSKDGVKVKKPAWKNEMYTPQMTQQFLDKTFSRTAEYNEAIKDRNNPANLETLKQVGLGQKQSSELYAQGKNPYIDMDKQLSLISSTEKSKSQSLLGISIPTSYLNDSVRSQLVNAGVVKPEEIKGQLGESTGWQVPVYNALTTDELLAIENNVLDTQIKNTELEQAIERHGWAKTTNRNAILLFEHKARMFADEEKAKEFDALNAKLEYEYNQIIHDVTDAKKQQKWDMERAEILLKQARQELTEVDLEQQVIKNSAIYRKVKEKLDLMKPTDKGYGETSMHLTQLDNAIKRDMAVNRMLANKNMSKAQQLSEMYQLQDRFEIQAKIKLGFSKEEASPTNLEQAGGAVDKKGSTFFMVKNNDTGVYEKFYEGTDTYMRLAKQSEEQAMSDMINAFAKVNDDGTFEPYFEGNDEIERLIMGYKNDKFNVNEFKAGVAQNIDFDELTKYKNAIGALQNELITQAGGPPGRVSVPKTEILSIMMEENQLQSTDDAINLYNYVESLIENPTQIETKKEEKVTYTTEEERIEEEKEKAQKEKFKKDKTIALDEVTKTKKAKPYLDYVIQNMLNGYEGVSKSGGRRRISFDTITQALTNAGMDTAKANQAIEEWSNKNFGEKFTDTDNLTYVFGYDDNDIVMQIARN